MSKPYDWIEAKAELRQHLERTSHVQTYGTIGSCDIDHDVDTIITKKPGSSSAEFFEDIHRVFDGVDEYLQSRHNARLIRTSRFSDEEKTKFIADCRPNDLVFQVTYCRTSSSKCTGTTHSATSM